MTMHQASGLRTGNKALSYLVSHYPRDAKLQIVIDSLPKFADELYGDARKAARGLLRSHTPNPLTLSPLLCRGERESLAGMVVVLSCAGCAAATQLPAFFSLLIPGVSRCLWLNN